jgi:hypothetical protein
VIDQTLQLKRLSPTLAERLRQCFLQVYWGASSSGTYNPGPPARLGLVVHDVLSEASGGQFKKLTGDAFEQEFVKLWDASLSKQQRDFDSNAGVETINLRHWRTYETLRANTRRVIQEINESTYVDQFVEHDFQGRGGLIHGTPDRVVVMEKETRVEDYKTGAIYDSEAEGFQRLKESYRRQVLFYAALVGESLGHWPNRARIIGLTSSIEDLEINQSEADEVIEESLALFRLFNARVQQVGEAQDLATPNEHACSLCTYQSTCVPHWRAVRAGWTSYISLSGTVESVQHAGNWSGLWLSVQNGTVEPGSYLVARLDRKRFALLDQIQVGGALRITNLRVQGKGFVPGWATTILPL